MQAVEGSLFCGLVDVNGTDAALVCDLPTAVGATTFTCAGGTGPQGGVQGVPFNRSSAARAHAGCSQQRCRYVRGEQEGMG